MPGWLVMDHGISLDGQQLYFNNARFDPNCVGACETVLGIAQKLTPQRLIQSQIRKKSCKMSTTQIIFIMLLA